MDSQKRLLVALGLSFLLTMLYVTFFAQPPAPGAPDAGAAPDAGIAAPLAVAPPWADAGVAPEPEPVPQEVLPEVQVERVRPQVHYVLSSEGAAMVQAKLQGPKMREQPHLSVGEGLGKVLGRQVPTPPQMDLTRPVPGRAAPMAISIEGPQPFPASTRYRVQETPTGGVEFTGSSGPWRVRRSYEWKSDFELVQTVELTNTSSQPAAGELAVHVSRQIDPTREEVGSFFGGIGNQSRSACFVGESLEHIVPPSEPEPSPEFRGPIRFFAIDQQYFLSAVYPMDAPREGRCVLTATPIAREAVAYFPVQVGPGASVVQTFGTFVGPKDVDELAKVPASTAAGGTYLPGLEETVDFGIWAAIVKVLLWVLKFFHGLTSNWGVAIILLTVLVKIVLLPLTHKSMVAAESMKKLQPQMEVIRKKFAEDKERQNAEMMKLYQEAKVNPLGGCLPLLFQLPIWAALFTTLRTSYDLYAEPFINPIWADLTYKDPTYILPLALGLTMIVTQKLQPQMMDATQAKVMTYGMPIFFTAIMLNYPAGLSLYIFTNNVLSIAQQYALRRYLERTGQAAPATKPGKPKKG